MLRWQGVGATKVYRKGWYRNRGGNGTGLHKGDADEYDATCSDVNEGRSGEEL